MIEYTEGTVHYRTFLSLSEYADYADKYVDVMSNGDDINWVFGEPGHYSNRDAIKMARMGWDRHLDDALDFMDDAIQEIDKQLEVPQWKPTWDVTGSAVDIGQYLSGEPECMIDFPLTVTPATGRVVTICSSVSASGSVSSATILRRGFVIAALATWLERHGYNTEIWADDSTSSSHMIGYRFYQRILIKGANDTIDPSRILYAMANPSMLRVLGFSVMHGLPEIYRLAFNVDNHGYGMPLKPKEDLPEGTIYIKEIFTAEDYDAKAELMAYLKQLGIIE